MNALRRVSGLAALVVAFLAIGARPSVAASFSINFCPGGNGCPANITEASLTFSENLGTADVNDYVLDLKIVGGAGDPTYIDQVSFTINTADNVTGAGGYEVKPSLMFAPGGIASWTVFYDNVNNGSGCTADSNSSQEVCAQSGATINSGKGALVNGTNIWTFSVDLADDLAALAAGSQVNLRAVLLTADGGNGGILSPMGGRLCAGGVESCNTTNVPEPASVTLFGSGLLVAVRALNRRRR